MEASETAAVKATSKSHAAASGHSERAASRSPEAARGARKSTAVPGKGRPTHARRPTKTAMGRSSRAKGPRHQVTQGVRNSRGSASQGFTERDADWSLSLSCKGAVEERMVYQNTLGADRTAHDYT